MFTNQRSAIAPTEVVYQLKAEEIVIDDQLIM